MLEMLETVVFLSPVNRNLLTHPKRMRLVWQHRLFNGRKMTCKPELAAVQTFNHHWNQTLVNSVAHKVIKWSFKAARLGHTYSTDWKIPSSMLLRAMIALTNLSLHIRPLDQLDQPVVVTRRE
jgi:hypothetical protein